ncbi:FKBP-type peptidyl-prolyl cis-trans isomerase [Micromonospora sp. 4G55]|uniref:FKBP-type peptidyl-prolyl cis-trans isomerase n=1 Tax=Micromonospora sp. 4G55 TaxID=2806102 RepID=UPI001A530EC3|nr:FKBP-type peptidyl-prolyl cis-trans isomerase [Micromonospora sp. 4G55]MBM0258803.1 FKBP-type peptidyl-prolyl cis-trans isomerase [Micromonospora sp. 4G55]
MLIIGIVALSGCSDPEAKELPTVSGKFGDKPAIIFSGSPIRGFQKKIVSEGNGPHVGGNDYIKAHVTSQVWGKGKSSSTYEKGVNAAQVFQLNASDSPPLANRGIPGTRVGSRILMTDSAGDAFGGHIPRNVNAEDVVVVVVDVLAAASVDPGIISQGRAAPPQRSAMPRVTGRAGSKPVVTVPEDFNPSRKLRADNLILGIGPKVNSGQTIIAHSFALGLANRKVFQNTWESGHPGAYPLGAGVLVKGFEEGLTGKNVGDRVLLIIPTEMAYGDSPPPNSGISKGEALFFVVDILATL